MIYICNTFSMHMLKKMNLNEQLDLSVTRISANEAGRILRSNAFRSYYGHEDGASNLGAYLHMTIPVSRGMIKFRRGDIVIIATKESKRITEKGYRSSASWKFYLLEYREEEE